MARDYADWVSSFQIFTVLVVHTMDVWYSKTCVKRPLCEDHRLVFKGSILQYFPFRPLLSKIFLLSIFEWLFLHRFYCTFCKLLFQCPQSSRYSGPMGVFAGHSCHFVVVSLCRESFYHWKNLIAQYVNFSLNKISNTRCLLKRPRQTKQTQARLSSVARVFPVCYSCKHFVNSSPGKQHF